MTTLNFALEIKALSAREFEGYGSVFGNVDHHSDIVLPGAFKRSLREHKSAGELPAMFWMHKPDQVAGVWRDMKEDERGLHVRGELADTQLGNEMRTLLKMKAVRGMSIGGRAVDIDWDRNGVRLLKEFDLMEVSLVALGANPLAKVEHAKSRLSDLGEYVPTEREFERVLRDAGFSRKVATRVVAKVFDDETDSGTLRHSHLRDSGDVESDEAEAMELMRALNQLTDKVGAAALSR